MEPIARQLYQEIAMIEEEHVTHYESLVDPGETWWERLMLHEYNEVYLYHSFMTHESDPKVKAIWELHLNMEIEQLRIAVELFREHDERDPDELLPPELPAPVTFEPKQGVSAPPARHADRSHHPGCRLRLRGPRAVRAVAGQGHGR